MIEDGMVFNAVFNVIVVTSWQPKDLLMFSRIFFLKKELPTIFFPIYWLLSHMNIVETMTSVRDE